VARPECTQAIAKTDARDLTENARAMAREENAMRDLIEALTILMKYGGVDQHAPTHCEHDVLFVSGIGVLEGTVSADDASRLVALGFFWNGDCWASFRFGSS
jgi:hypothetical protein